MTTSPPPFATVTMDGDQFKDGHLPVRALAELQRYSALVLRAAELKWQEDHPGHDLPDDFHESFELIISEVRPGSATSVLERSQTSPYDTYYEEGRLDFEAALQGILSDQVEDSWRQLLAAEEFGEFGSSLDKGESLSIPPTAPEIDYLIEITPESFRGKIHSAHQIAATPPTVPAPLALPRTKTEGWVVARLVALNGLKSSFTVLVDKREVNGKFGDSEVFDDLKAVLGTSEKSPVVRIYGRLSFLGKDLDRILKASQVQVLEVDGEPWSGRFIELAHLEEGWNEESTTSASVAFSALDGARAVLQHVSKADLNLPGIYPTEEGGVSLEWASARRVITIEISPDGVFEMNRFSRDGERSAIEPTQNLDDVKKFVDDADIVEAVRG